ncbi:MAG TPA: hypothetical protein VFA62_07965 [Acidimicrobiia bacterium]|nr:hypothetical protein [Acidimicrobiia bacterium]
MTRVGVLGSPDQALVDGHGAITPDGSRWQLDWWVGADDRWHLPAREAAVRQTLVGAAPVVETSVRIPSGDAVHRAWGVGGPAGLVAVEIENASPAPFVAALVIGPTAAGRVRSVATRGSWVTVDGHAALLTPRPASRWAAGTPGETFDAVEAGQAQERVFTGVGGRRTRLEVALLHPVAHRTRLRCALSVGRPGRSVPVDAVDLSLLPDAETAAAGWDAQLRRGMRVVVPDARLERAIDAGRAELLLAADGRRRPTAEDVAALEDWGFDAEATVAWRRLGIRARARASRRAPDASPWRTVRARLASASSTFTWPDGPATLLRALRDLLVGAGDDESADLLVELPAEWRGQGVEVHDAPTRAGRVSYAVRWHGPRPALLWECERPIRLRAPGLDPAWSTSEARGEALLAAPTGPSPGAESFS